MECGLVTEEIDLEAARFVLESLPEEQKQRLYDHVKSIVDILSDAFCNILDDLAEMISEITKALAESLGPAIDSINAIREIISQQDEYLTVATGREWHFYLYGSKKVSKKWQNEFERRLKRQNRRNGK